MSEIYRDRTEGAVARRKDLLQRRRDELVMMPHAVRRVVVARRARIAASLAVIGVATALVAAACKPALAAWLERGLPYSSPAPLTSLLAATWVAAIAAYLMSRARAEHRFAVAMSHYVLPGDDLDQDLERLSHEHPDEQARHMAHRLEVRSAALPVAAAAMLLPATAIYLVAAVRARGWPLISDLEVDLATHRGVLAFGLGAAIAGAIAMTRRGPRASVLPASALGLCVLVLAGVAPSWWLAAPAAIAAAMAVIASRLDRERARIAAEDPAAGSELFTIRGALGVARAHLAKLRARIPRRSVVIAVPVACALVGVGASAHRPHAQLPAPAPAPAPAQLPAPQRIVAPSHAVPVTLPDVNADYVIHRQGAQLVVDVAPSPTAPIAVTVLDEVPAGWHVDLAVHQRSGVPVGIAGPTEIDVCGAAQPVILRIAGGAPAQLDITPKLTLATCDE